MQSSAVRVEDGSKVVEARRAALEHARGLAWGEVPSANAAIVVTELATNLAKHARDGVVSITTLDGAKSRRMQILAVDHGPGILDVEKSFRDGYSTAGSPGNGLGAVRRLASSLEVVSARDKGTVLMAEIDDSERTVQSAERFAVGGLCVQRSGESVSGDAFDARHESGCLAVFVCDGLGHGTIAAQAAQAAVETFREGPALNPVESMTRIHHALRPTRGAAAAIALVDPSAGTVRYCGVGNISAMLVTQTASTRHLVSHNGTLGHTLTKIAEFTYPWSPGDSLVMHSDGVSAKWKPEEWPGLWLRAPALIAGVIYRDCRRERDDATVVVARAQ